MMHASTHHLPQHKTDFVYLFRCVKIRDEADGHEARRRDLCEFFTILPGFYTDEIMFIEVSIKIFWKHWHSKIDHSAVIDFYFVA